MSKNFEQETQDRLEPSQIRNIISQRSSEHKFESKGKEILSSKKKSSLQKRNCARKLYFVQSQAENEIVSKVYNQILCNYFK